MTETPTSRCTGVPSGRDAIAHNGYCPMHGCPHSAGDRACNCPTGRTEVPRPPHWNDLEHADPCTCTINKLTGEVVNYDCGETLMHQRDAAALNEGAAEGPPNTAWFCDKAKEIIGAGGQRRQDYGDALDSFESIATMWSAILGTTVSAEQVALCQVALKMGRLFQKPNHTDSWVDIIGYAALGGDISHREGRHI